METQFTQVGRVSDEPNGAMLVIGSGAFGEEGSRLGGWGCGCAGLVKSLPSESSVAVCGPHYTLVTQRNQHIS